MRRPEVGAGTAGRQTLDILLCLDVRRDGHRDAAGVARRMSGGSVLSGDVCELREPEIGAGVASDGTVRLVLPVHVHGLFFARGGTGVAGDQSDGPMLPLHVQGLCGADGHAGSAGDLSRHQLLRGNVHEVQSVGCGPRRLARDKPCGLLLSAHVQPMSFAEVGAGLAGKDDEVVVLWRDVRGMQIAGGRA